MTEKEKQEEKAEKIKEQDGRDKTCGDCIHWVWEMNTVYARAIGHCPHRGEPDEKDATCDYFSETN